MGGIMTENTNIEVKKILACAKLAETLWNDEADELNQWENLGRDEQDVLFALQLQSAALSNAEPAGVVRKWIFQNSEPYPVVQFNEGIDPVDGTPVFLRPNLPAPLSLHKIVELCNRETSAAIDRLNDDFVIKRFIADFALHFCRAIEKQHGIGLCSTNTGGNDNGENE